VEALSLSGGAAQVSSGGGAVTRSTKLPAFSLHLPQPISALRVSLSLAVLSIPWHGGDGAPGTAPVRRAGTTAARQGARRARRRRGEAGRRGMNSPRVREGGSGGSGRERERTAA